MTGSTARILGARGMRTAAPTSCSSSKTSARRSRCICTAARDCRWFRARGAGFLAIFHDEDVRARRRSGDRRFDLFEPGGGMKALPEK
jgi:alpha-D-ribose 1-methylphosphonate 5-triphosphate synthase subunit PhnL